MQHEGRWEEAAQRLVAAGQGLQRAGAEVVVLCTNTMHKLAETIQAGLRVPLLHVADATALRIKRAGIQRVGLLGTRFTMEEDFFQGRLARQFGLDMIVPVPNDRKEVHRIIYEELCVGLIRPESRVGLHRIMTRLAERSAEGIILGCTELGLLVGNDDSPVPLFDTTRIHALAAVDFALQLQGGA
jgi:aspartate racemase